MESQHEVLEREGASVHYWVGGKSSGPIVVLSHGATVDHHEWDNTTPILGEQYRVLTWDVPGHGLSRPGRFSVAGAVEVLLAILDALRVHQATLVGHSMGGNLHQELVFHHPERVAAMVCVDCTWNFQKLSAWESLALKAAKPLFKLYPHRLLIDQSLAATVKSKASQEFLRPAMSSLNKDEFVDIMAAMSLCLHYEPGYAINKPLLLIVGDEDRTGNIRSVMPRWAEQEPDAALVVIPGARHAPNLDAPDVFHRELVNFLQKTIG